MTATQDKINLFKRFSMTSAQTSADVQLIDRIRLQEHVPPAGSFEVYSSPGVDLVNRDQQSILLGFESRMSVFFGVLATDAVFFFGLLNNCFKQYFW